MCLGSKCSWGILGAFMPYNYKMMNHLGFALVIVGFEGLCIAARDTRGVPLMSEGGDCTQTAVVKCRNAPLHCCCMIFVFIMWRGGRINVHNFFGNNVFDLKVCDFT